VTRKEFEITDEEFAEMAAQIRIEGEKAQKRAQEDLLKAQEDATKQLGELELTVLKSTGHIREAIEKEAEAAIAVWEERAKKGIITEQELARARILILTNAATDMEKALESASGTADTSGIAFESWARNFTDDLAGAITKMKDLDDVLKNFLLRLLQAELSNSLFNLFGLGKGGGGGGGFGGIVVPALSSIFGFANGGRPRANRVSLVGEHEPEFFIPDTAGEIYPLSKLGKEGTQVVLNINAPGADAGVVERVRLLAQTEIIPQAVQASLYAYRSTMRPSH
jgi:cell pole-organizing protein PopZ